MGLEAFGVDRHLDADRDYLSSADWLDYRLEAGAWGTVISHMAFSKHFIHRYLRSDGEDYAYAMKYREILDSLRPGGVFLYAPSLPFVERHLDAKAYELTLREAAGGLCASAVRRR
jgi:hypothetical protein